MKLRSFKLITLIMCLTGIWVLTGCRKEKFKEYHIDEGTRAYFNWQKGTYWIFKDSLNGNTDTFIVFDYHPLGRVEKYYSTEELTISIGEHNIRDSIPKFWELDIYAGRGLSYSHLSNPYRTYAYYNYTVGFPFESNKDAYFERSMLSSVLIGNIEYHDVYRYYMKYDDTHADELLSNADKGFIKISLNNNYAHEVLELQSSHIIH